MTILLFLIGVVFGALVNGFVDRFGWLRKYRSPWSGFPESYRSKIQLRLIDYVPVLGWFTMPGRMKDLFAASEKKTCKKRKKFPTAAIREEGPVLPGLEGRFFWIRPLMVELGLGFLAVFLYQIEVVQQGLSLQNLFFYGTVKTEIPLAAASGFSLKALFAFHFLLCVFMLAATLTDFDDYIISDALIIPGTLIGILAGTFIPGAVFVPLIFFYQDGGQICFQSDLSGYFQSIGSNSFWEPFLPLAIMIACWTLWCFAMLDRRFYLKLGVRKAVILFFRVLKRSKLTVYASIIYLSGLLFIGGIFFADPQGVNSGSFLSCRAALFNILISLTVGLLMIWIVRLISRIILHKEAMGFGDVMLMGMIAVYLGWQGTFIVFFIAPVAGIIFAVIRMFCGMERQIPYGPFLCLGAFIFLLKRVAFWYQIEFFFSDPLLVAILASVCVVLFAVLLYLLELIKKMILRLMK